MNDHRPKRSRAVYPWSLAALTGASLAQAQSPALPGLQILPGPLLVASASTGSVLTLQSTDDLKEVALWSFLTNLPVAASPSVVLDLRGQSLPDRRFFRALTCLSNMVYVPPGTFLLGSPDDEFLRWPDEGPQTQVTLTSGFYMGTHEVTQGEYLSITATNPSTFIADSNCPVEGVSWADATNYCARLTARERKLGHIPGDWAYGLPTEAQWEYACRAGTTNRYSFGDDINSAQLPDYAWFNDNAKGSTHPVGQKRPNPWGLHDMHGNVWEWCSDWYASYPGGSLTNSTGAKEGSYHVARGGSWNDSSWTCRSAARALDMPAQGLSGWLGFRVVLAPLKP